MKTKFDIGILVGLIMSFMLTVNVNAQDNALSSQDSQAAASIIKVGDIAPGFMVEMLDGNSMKLSDMKGKVVLLNFWATWCGPCMNEFKEIPEKIIKRFGENPDFIFIPVSRGETREAVQKKMDQLKENGIDFPVGLDSDKTIYSLYAKSYIPRNYLIDRDGKVVYTSIGYEEKEFAGMADKIADLLK
ncbi:MAG: TlpA family protein disulfide reductase [Tannerella sp.]|nr:TlpA family protein disulfide reductase [Tannerella sp.]